MPIYEYRCENCGFQKEYLQKASDPPVTDCPQCERASMVKLVSAAGFQLKGSGWYATDFKGSSASKKSDDGKSAEGAKSEAKTETKSDAAGSSGGGCCGGSCACG